MRIRDFMTPEPVTCRPDTTLQEVGRMMDQADTGIIPIVDGNRVVGVITDRDIAIRAVADGANAQTARAFDYATRDVKCLQADDDIESAIETMESNLIRRVAVMDGERLCGMLSLGDLAETVSDEAEDVLVEVSKSQKTLAHSKDLGSSGYGRDFGNDD